MANINGQRAKPWGVLPTNNGEHSLSEAKKLGSNEESAIFEAVNEIISENIKSLYGDVSDEKYRNIVDLILSRIGDVTDDALLDLRNVELENVKIDLVNEFKKLTSTSRDINVIIPTIAKNIVDAISTNVSNDIDKLLNDLTKLFDGESNEDAEKTKTQDYVNGLKILSDVSEPVDIIKIVNEFDTVSQSKKSSAKRGKAEREVRKKIALLQKRLSRLEHSMNILDNIIDTKSKTFKVLDLLSILSIFSVGSKVKFVSKVLFKFLIKVFEAILLDILIPFAITLFTMGYIVNSLFRPIIDEVMSIISSIKQIIHDCYDIVFTPIINFWLVKIGPPLKKLLFSVGNMIIHVFNSLRSSFSIVLNGINKFFAETFNTLKLFSQGYLSNGDIISEKIIKFIMTCGEVLVDLINGMSDRMPTIINACVSLVSSVSDAINNLMLGIRSRNEKIADSLANIYNSILCLSNKFMSGWQSKYTETNFVISDAIIGLQKRQKAFETAIDMINDKINDIINDFNIGLNTYSPDVVKKMAMFHDKCNKTFIKFMNKINSTMDEVAELASTLVKTLISIGTTILNKLKTVIYNIIENGFKFWTWFSGLSDSKDKAISISSILDIFKFIQNKLKDSVCDKIQKISNTVSLIMADTNKFIHKRLARLIDIINMVGNSSSLFGNIVKFFNIIDIIGKFRNKFLLFRDIVAYETYKAQTDVNISFDDFRLNRGLVVPYSNIDKHIDRNALERKMAEFNGLIMSIKELCYEIQFDSKYRYEFIQDSAKTMIKKLQKSENNTILLDSPIGGNI